MKKYLFYYPHLVVGGIEVLICNLTSEIIREGDKAFILCESAFDEIIGALNKDVSLIQMHDKFENDKEIKNIIINQIGVECNAIAFTWGDYCRLYVISPYRVIFYACHYLFFSDVINGGKFIKRLFTRFLSRKPFIKLSKLNNFIAMDEATIENANIAFKYNFSQDIDVVRLPSAFNESDYKPEIALSKFKQEKERCLP